MMKRNIIFEMTSGCNFRCKYCFESHNVGTVKNIDYGTIDNSLIKIISEEKVEYMVTFFGGEPLLCFDKIRYIVEKGKNIARKNNCYIMFNVVTNGSLCTGEVNEFLIKNNIYTFFSFDGNQEIQNKYRILPNRDSYEEILTNIKDNINRQKDVYTKDCGAVRITVTKDLLPKLVDTYLFLRDEIRCPKITFALVSAKPGEEYALNKESLEILEEIYFKLAEIYIAEIKNGKSVNRFFESIVRNIVCGNHKLKFCRCDDDYVAIGADGKVYPCEGFLGYSEFVYGNINEKINFKDKSGIGIENSLENIQCKKCWAKYLCAGSCYHECYMRHGDVNVKDEFMCETYKCAISTGIYIYNRLLNENLIDKFIKISFETIFDDAVPVIDFDNVYFDRGKKILFYSDSDEYCNINLDEVAVDILSLCNKRNTVRDITDRLSDLYNTNKMEMYTDISEFLSDLKRKGIIYLVN